MPIATVKEGTFHTSHRSVGQIEKGQMSGQAHHEVQFGGISALNMKTHAVIPHFERKLNPDEQQQS